MQKRFSLPHSSFLIPLLFVLGCLFLVAPNSVHAGGLLLPPNNLGLVAYWPLNEGSGTVAADASGKGNTGTLTNGPTWGRGKAGKGVVFDGGNDVITIPTQDTLFTENGAITISAWIYARSYGGSSLGRIIDRSNTSDGPCFQFVLGKLYFQVDGATDLIRSGGTTIPLNQWVHVSATWDGSTTASNVKLYVNGREDSYVDTISAVSLNDNSTAPFRIGNRTGSSGFDGTMDEVRIYNRVLTSAEILSLYKNSQQYFVNGALSNTGLVGYWSLNDGNGSIATDFSGKRNHGALTSSPTWVDGKFGKALRFSGSNYVSINDNPSIRPTSITVSAWIRANSVTTGVRAGVVSKWFLSALWGYSIETGLASCDAGAGDGARTGIKFMFRSTAVSTDTCAFSNLSEIPGKWQHVVGTFDESSGDAKIYIDGVLISTVDKTAGTLHQPLSPLGIGAINDNSSWGKNFDGTIDEVRIYNRALSDSEVATLYGKTRSVVVNKSIAGITNGLVGWWTMDGGDINWATGVVTDKSPSGNNGNFVGLATTTGPVLGKIGQAMRFNGTTDYVKMGNVYAFERTDPFSVSVWVKRGVLSSNQRFFGKMKASSGNRGWVFQLSTSNAATVALNSTSGTNSLVVNTTNTFTDTNNWHHYAFTYDGSSGPSGVRIYVDGVQEATSASFNSLSATIVDATVPFQIGARDGADSPFGGLVDDARIYNRVLSSTEINRLYLMGR